MGRFPVLVPFHSLDVDILVKILKEPEDSLVSQYRALLRTDNVTLEFTANALRAIAKQSMEEQTGARGLRGIMVRSECRFE